jgi:hypothetical protein
MALKFLGTTTTRAKRNFSYRVLGNRVGSAYRPYERMIQSSNWIFLIPSIKPEGKDTSCSKNSPMFLFQADEFWRAATLLDVGHAKHLTMY